jgi:hypothetical protein
MDSPRPGSPIDQARSVRESTGARRSGQSPAGVRRPLVATASYVPSDVEPPRYNLPSADYIKRYKEAQTQDLERNKRDEERAKESGEGAATRRPRGERPGKKPKRNPWVTVRARDAGPLRFAPCQAMIRLAMLVLAPSFSLTLGQLIHHAVTRRSRHAPLPRAAHTLQICLIVCVLGGLAMLALMAMASLAVYECSPRNEAFTHDAGPPGLDAPCVALTRNFNGECTAPGVYTAYVNRTGGECCMPQGYVCAVDSDGYRSCPSGSVRVSAFIGMGPGERMCCHPEGLGATSVALLQLVPNLKNLQDQTSRLSREGFKSEDLDTLASQLNALEDALTKATAELPHALELVTTSLGLAKGALTKRAAEEAAKAAQVRKAAEDAARERAEREAAAAAAEAAKASNGTRR